MIETMLFGFHKHKTGEKTYWTIFRRRRLIEQLFIIYLRHTPLKKIVTSTADKLPTARFESQVNAQPAILVMLSGEKIKTPVRITLGNLCLLPRRKLPYYHNIDQH